MRSWRSLLRAAVIALAAVCSASALSGCNGFFIDGHTSTILTSSVVSAAYEASVTLTATVSSTQATGTVTFYDGSSELGTATLSAGKATYTTTALAEGTHSLTADYGGDTTYQASNSDALTVVISATLTSTTTTLSASALSVTAGSSVTLTATISYSAATGTVNFYDASGSAVALLGTGDVSSGTAIFSTTTLATGTHTLYAIYVGDSTYATSTSSTISVGIT